MFQSFNILFLNCLSKRDFFLHCIKPHTTKNILDSFMSMCHQFFHYLSLFSLKVVQSSYLCSIVIDRSLKNHGNVSKTLVIHDVSKASQANFSFADILMSVQMAAQLTCKGSRRVNGLRYCCYHSNHSDNAT